MKKFQHRKPIPKKKSQRLFTNTAKGAHPKNNAPKPMRGGIRL